MLRQAASLVDLQIHDNQEIQGFGKYAELLDTTFAKLEALSRDDARTEPGMEIVNVILLLIESMLDALDLTAALKAMPDGRSPWPGTETYRIVERFKKLSQYRSVARYLLYAARKFSVFRNLDIEEVITGPFPESSSGTSPPSFEFGLLSRSSMTDPRNREIGVDFGKQLESFLSMKLSIIRHKVQTDAEQKKKSPC